MHAPAVRIGLAALALLATPSRAEPIAVLGAEAVGVPDAEATALTGALRDAMKSRPGVELMPGKDLVEMRLLFGCTDESGAQLAGCMAQAGKSLVADELLLATLTAEGPQARGRGKVRVRLRLLDVTAARFVRDTHETVEASALAPKSVRATAERLLAQLLSAPVVPPPPPVAKAPVPAAPPVTVAPAATATSAPTTPDETSRRARAFRIGGYVGLAVAVALAGAAIGTGLESRSLHNQADQSLVDVRDENPGYYLSHTDQFTPTPRCALDGAPSTPTVSRYLDQCRNGEHDALAANVLWVGAGLVAAGGVASLLWAAHVARPSEKRASRGSGLVIAPAVGRGTGGATVSFAF